MGGRERKEEGAIIPTGSEEFVHHSEAVLLETVCLGGLVNGTEGVESVVI